jgi:hypothetical protein
MPKGIALAAVALMDALPTSNSVCCRALQTVHTTQHVLHQALKLHVLLHPAASKPRTFHGQASQELVAVAVVMLLDVVPVHAKYDLASWLTGSCCS